MIVIYRLKSGHYRCFNTKIYVTQHGRVEDFHSLKELKNHLTRVIKAGELIQIPEKNLKKLKPLTKITAVKIITHIRAERSKSQTY